MKFFLLTLALPSVAFAADIDACLSLPSAPERTACYETICAFDLACARSLVSQATEAGGPEAGISVLDDLMALGRHDVTKDGHDLAHQVGRTAARHFGGDWETFMRCPDDYLLGCKHGFFEAMLGELGSSVDAASAVCDDAPKSERVFCFHGMGHGIMMANGNDIDRSLFACKGLPDDDVRRGCYQGVFMENVNAVQRGEAKSDTFDDADILAPCSRIDPTYRSDCFAQHADYLLKTLSGSLEGAVAACEGAGETAWIDICVRHMGQNMTIADYQRRFLGSYESSRAADGAFALCKRFPEKHHETCRMGAAYNFMLYDHPEDAVRFCTLSGDAWCPVIVGTYLRRAIYDDDDRETICALFLDAAARETCLFPPEKRSLSASQVTLIALFAAAFAALLLRLARR